MTRSECHSPLSASPEVGTCLDGPRPRDELEHAPPGALGRRPGLFVLSPRNRTAAQTIRTVFPRTEAIQDAHVLRTVPAVAAEPGRPRELRGAGPSMAVRHAAGRGAVSAVPA